jgi:hypothetical protein
MLRKYLDLGEESTGGYEKMHDEEFRNLGFSLSDVWFD